MMATQKTLPSTTDAQSLIESITDDTRRQDCEALLKLMKSTMRCDPVVWGDSTIGFGTYHYVYPTGREGDWFTVGFSSRKQNLSIHILPDLDAEPELLESLGKFKRGVSCLYVKKLEDIDMKVLKKLIQSAKKRIKTLYGNR